MFAYLKKLDVTDATSWMDIPEVKPDARLLLRFAGESNKEYWNAMLRRSGKRIRRMARMDSAIGEELAKSRADDCELYPRHVFVDWEGVEDTGGNLVEFSLDMAKHFCVQLPDWLFDRVRAHASAPERFLDSEEDLPPDSVELAEKSPSDSDMN